MTKGEAAGHIAVSTLSGCLLLAGGWWVVLAILLLLGWALWS